MGEILLVVAPVFLLIGAGYGAVRAGYLDGAVADALNAFAVRLAVPALLFLAIYRLDFSRAFDAGMLTAFYSGAIASFGLAVALARLAFGRTPAEAVAVGFSAMFSNTVLLGLPIIERAWGKDALAPAFAIVALHAPLLYVIGMTAMEMARRGSEPLGVAAGRTLRAILGNALMIGILAGAVCNGLAIRLPAPVEASAAMLAAAAIPAALVGIGAALTRYRIAAHWREAAAISALALLLHPAIALGLSQFAFGLPAEQMRAAVVLAAMPPGMNIYVFAVMYRRAEPLAASAILLATALAPATVSVWLAILGRVAG
jgi:hypothetical protein